MSDTQRSDLQGDSTAKDPQDWSTGGEPATGAQMSYLQTMTAEANEEAPQQLTKAQASAKIEELQAKTGRHGEPTTS